MGMPVVVVIKDGFAVVVAAGADITLDVIVVGGVGATVLVALVVAVITEVAVAVEGVVMAEDERGFLVMVAVAF